ncbi:MAG: hypothetical protein R2856_25320 [Caldilineaceae bacterium]
MEKADLSLPKRLIKYSCANGVTIYFPDNSFSGGSAMWNYFRTANQPSTSAASPPNSWTTTAARNSPTYAPALCKRLSSSTRPRRRRRRRASAAEEEECVKVIRNT